MLHKRLYKIKASETKQKLNLGPHTLTAMYTGSDVYVSHIRGKNHLTVSNWQRGKKQIRTEDYKIILIVVRYGI